MNNDKRTLDKVFIKLFVPLLAFYLIFPPKNALTFSAVNLLYVFGCFVFSKKLGLRLTESVIRHLIMIFFLVIFYAYCCVSASQNPGQIQGRAIWAAIIITSFIATLGVSLINKYKRNF